MIRLAVADDLPHLKRALYEAIAWNPERELPPLEWAIEHPELARYYAGWGRPGDLAVVAESEAAAVGASLCRLFTDDDHGHGFVDATTPELAVAVWDGRRGQGIGSRLVEALEELARGEGYERLSLSVDTDNPARRLYVRLGYEELTVDEDGVRMLKTL